jgi:hypothetical protein
MEVNDVIVVFFFQFMYQQIPIIVEIIKFINVRIGSNYFMKVELGEVMHFCIGHLLFETTDDGGGENNVSNRAESDD